MVTELTWFPHLQEMSASIVLLQCMYTLHEPKSLNHRLGNKYLKGKQILNIQTWQASIQGITPVQTTIALYCLEKYIPSYYHIMR